MKKQLFLVLFAYIISISAVAQTSVELNINHKLADADFAMNTAAQNNMGRQFNVTRLQYYISEMTILHDGGIETPVGDVFVLVNANEATTVNLGTLPVISVEGFRFYIGVDPDFNHLDPSMYPAGHPLAPQFPSMHWGWASGYRFLAMEGKGGNTLLQTYELHGLGDDNYFQVEVPVTTVAENNEVTISLDADYTRVLENIGVHLGPIVHGDFGDAVKALENLRDYVFAASSSVTATDALKFVERFDVFPNPSIDGTVIIATSTTDNAPYQINVTDVLGRNVQTLALNGGIQQAELQIDNTGLYLITLVKNGQTVTSKQLVVH